MRGGSQLFLPFTSKSMVVADLPSRTRDGGKASSRQAARTGLASQHSAGWVTAGLFFTDVVDCMSDCAY